jgi:hypothetical protein
VVTGHIEIQTWGVKHALRIDAKGGLYLHPKILNIYMNIMDQQKGEPRGTLDREPVEDEVKSGVSAYCLLALSEEHFSLGGMSKAVLIMVLPSMSVYVKFGIARKVFVVSEGDSFWCLYKSKSLYWLDAMGWNIAIKTKKNVSKILERARVDV